MVTIFVSYVLNIQIKLILINLNLLFLNKNKSWHGCCNIVVSLKSLYKNIYTIFGEKAMNAQKGFTLIELMIVVAIMVFWQRSQFLRIQIIPCVHVFLRD